MTYTQLISEVEQMPPEEQWAIFMELSRLLREKSLSAVKQEHGGVTRVISRARAHSYPLNIAHLKREDFHERR